MIVVGTGPAGLTAAYLLAKRGHKVTLMDFADEPGGLWAGWEDQGRHFEKGMHNYVECGNEEIDEFFMELPLQRHMLEGNKRDLAGVYHNGTLYQRSPFLDLTGDAAHREIVTEILWNCLSPPPMTDRALDRAMYLFGQTCTERHIKPILRKLYGTTNLHARALDLTNLTRAVISHDETVMANLILGAPMRERMAWPNQLTLPKQYSSGRVGFYPAEGMRALVAAAIGRLREMGVEVLLGQPEPHCPQLESSCKAFGVVWAAGIPKLAHALAVNMPPIDARRLTVVNFSGSINTGALHYFFCYEPLLKTFRVTSYNTFSFYNQTSVELLDVPADQAGDLAISELKGMELVTKHTGVPEVVGVHELGPVLPLPTPSNDSLMDHLRKRLARPGLHIVGGHARNGLFFQPDVLRHVWTTVHCQIGNPR